MLNKFRVAEFLDKLVLLGAMIVFLAVGWSSIQTARSLDTISRQERPMLSSQQLDVDPVHHRTPAISFNTWDPPSSQSRGSKWTFDLFTPPKIYYNHISKEFAVTPPELDRQPLVANKWNDFGMELLEVRPRPYRLQLVGYAGEEGNYIAYFEYTPTGEIIIAREGRLLVEAGVKVASFEVKRMPVEQEGSMPIYENVGVAKLMDFESGEEIYLTNLETKNFSDLEARVRANSNGQVFLVREGSQLELSDSLYIIGEVSAAPQEVMVTRISREGDRRESRLLRPAGEPPSSAADRGRRKEASPFAVRPRPASREPQG